jgi:TM2 domain-containing membrane protein YozV
MAKIFFALASALIVGLGQILKGQTEKGFILLLTTYLAVPAILYLAFLRSGGSFLLLFGISVVALSVLWIYNVIDAFLSENPPPALSQQDLLRKGLVTGSTLKTTRSSYEKNN